MRDEIHKNRPARAALLIGFTIQGLAIARALNQEGIKVYALSQIDGRQRGVLKHPVYYSDHVTTIFAKSLRGDALVDALVTARRSIAEQQVVLYPATDNTVVALAKNWPALANHYILSWAQCRREVERVIQKRNLPEYCELAGIDYPKTVVIQSEDEIERRITKLSFPILIKPNNQSFSFKAHRCETEQELRNFVKSNIRDLPLVAQEWISGADDRLYFYSCFAVDGKEFYGFTGRKVRASPPETGIATVIETADEPGVRKAAQKLLPTLGLSGPVAMEFKKDSVGRYRFIEANIGRTEYCVDLAIQAGFNLPYVEFNFATGVPLPPLKDWVECIWFDTDKEPFCYAALCLRESALRPHGKTPVFPYYGQERWQVQIVAVLEIFRKLWVRAMRRLRVLLSEAKIFQ